MSIESVKAARLKFAAKWKEFKEVKMLNQAMKEREQEAKEEANYHARENHLANERSR